MNKRALVMGVLAPLFVLAPAVGASADDAPARVTGLRLEPGDLSSVALVIETAGRVGQWSDFTLEEPYRLVIDIADARSELPRGSYDGLSGGGVRGVRTSQYAADVVRVVIDLAAPRAYTIERTPDGLRVSISGGGEPGPLPAEEQPYSPASQQQEQPRISVRFENADILDVLATFAEFADRSIVPGRGVEGTVTAEIRDQPWDVALNAILQSQGLAAQELPSGIIRVDAIETLATRREVEPLATQIFRVNYVQASELQATIIPLLSERGRLSISESTNTIIITDVPAVLEQLAPMLGQLDIRTPQVAIQAKIIFVNRTDVEALGFTYDLKDSRGNSLNRLTGAPDPSSPGQFTNEDLVLLGGNSVALLGNANARVTGASLEAIVSLVLGRHTLVAFIDALQSQELADVQAHPLITTLDNQRAEILVGERTPIRVVDLGAQGAAGQQARATTELVETGIILEVTPHVTADGHILMDLHAERSSAQLAASDIGVIFQTQEGTTRLMVRDGETAVIGGLTVTEVSKTRTGIPLLMDIPLLGALFQTTRQEEQKQDLLIMVTPTIVN
ncbi:MAG: AMIN domain-containing protein [Longimicrobiaceae bacterium]